MKRWLVAALIFAIVGMSGYTFWHRNTIMPSDFLQLAAAIILLLVTAIYVFVISKQAEDTKTLANETKELVEQSRKANEAELAVMLTDIYSSPEMLRGMRLLRHWQRDKGEGFAGVFALWRETQYHLVEAEDHARRLYSHYFYRIRLLLELGVLNVGYIRTVVQLEQVEFYFDVIVPMEKAMNPNYDRRTADTFGEIYTDLRSD